MGVPSFKDCIAADIHGVFLDADEFAEKRTILYDGETYEGISVSLQDFAEEDRPRVTAPGSGRGGSDSAEGLCLVTNVMYCAREDLGGRIPKQGSALKIKSLKNDFFEEYRIISSGCEMGLLRAELRMVR